MADLTHTHSEPAECWPLFADGQSVLGWKLLDLADWVVRSNKVLDSRSDPGPMPVIALPPMQRSAVWRPKQVLDLWDSLMRGLPIGVFYLVRRSGDPKNVVAPGTNKTVPVSAAGFDLLDGQQRVRALMAGVLGPADDKRCLWIDLGTEIAGESPSLCLTPKAQPFGYDAVSGGKLHLDQRRKAREVLEPDPKEHPLQYKNEAGELRRAYDLELFEGEVVQDGERLSPQPPLPYGTCDGRVFELHKLLAAWRKRAGSSLEEGVAALRNATGNEASLQRSLVKLHDAFCKVAKAEAALLIVEPGSFRERESDLLTLFERVGAGGTPLSREERLYSIYKHYVPRIRDTVNEIHNRAGRVLHSIKIVAVALRVANALTDERRNNIPDPTEFIKAMTAIPESALRHKLDQLLPPASATSAQSDGVLSKSFVAVMSLLAYSDTAGNFWLPDVLLTSLPAEFWQVMVFWAAVQPGPAIDTHLCRQEVVRFALFWRLCVWNDEKAASTAFTYIKETATANTVYAYTRKTASANADFSWDALYQHLIGATQGDAYAYALIEPDEFDRKLCTRGDSSAWRTDEERFVENKQRNEIGSQWWWNGRKMLPWLQRDYIRLAFPGYVPLSEHEDDLPYDVDHICSHKDWGEWVSVRGRINSLDPKLQQRMRDGRKGVGDGIGNLRLIDSSVNRCDQDEDVAKKMPCSVAEGDPSDADRVEMAKLAFAPEHREFWRRVSRPGELKKRIWNDDRLAAFQRAVEERAAWLYRRFYEDLGYAGWTSRSSQSGKG